MRDVGQAPVEAVDPPALAPGRQWTTVEFSDLRFAYAVLGSRGTGGRSPLGGWVYIVDGHDMAAEGMGRTRAEVGLFAPDGKLYWRDGTARLTARPLDRRMKEKSSAAGLVLPCLRETVPETQRMRF